MKSVGTLIEAGASYQAGRFNRKVAEFNRTNALAEGNADAIDIANQGREAEGQQIVSQAGSGFAVGAGTAFDLLRQTEIETTFEIMKRRRAAEVTGLGYRMQGAAAAAQGKAAAISGVMKAAQEAMDYAGGMGGGG